MASAQKGAQTGSGARKSGSGGKSKSMKRCSHCGAKNKATFEYCIRCSEPLEDGAPEVVASTEGATTSKLFMGGLAAVALFAAAALVLRGFSGESEAPPAPGPPAASGEAPGVSAPSAPDASAIDSQEVLTQFNEAIAAFNQKDYGNAIGLFQDVIQQIPDNPTAHQYLGLAFFHLQEYPDALSALAAARSLRPDSFELLDHYVTVAKAAGDRESAATALRGYVERHPRDADARLELSRIARAMGRSEEALEQAAYLASAPDASPEFKYEYGVSLKEAGKLDEAIEALKSSIELDPSSAVAHHALGVTEFLSGKPREAVGPLEEAVAKAPDNGDFRFSLAQVYEKLDRIPESLAAYEAYLQRAKDSDPRAKVVRERLEVAKKALAERGTPPGERRKGGSS